MRDELDDEIDLRKYIDIAVKRKKIVFGVFFAAVFIAAVWSVLSPNVYEVSVIIGPPVMALTENGVLELDSIGNMKAKIESGAFNTKIINGLNIQEEDLKFQVSQPRDAKFIKVSLSRTAEQADIGKKALAKLVEVVGLSYVKPIEDRRNRIVAQIGMIRSRIDRKEIAMRENISNGVDYLSSVIGENRADIEKLKLSIDVMRNVAVIQEPLVSLKPIGPQKRKNVLLAGFVGVIVGLFAAFAAEHLESSQRDS